MWGSAAKNSTASSTSIFSKVAGYTFIGCYPNAGLPNPMSDTGFDETPEVTGALVEGFAKSGFLNLAGGCCGTTPEHIAEIARRVAAYWPHSRHGTPCGSLLAARAPECAGPARTSVGTLYTRNRLELTIRFKSMTCRRGT